MRLLLPALLVLVAPAARADDAGSFSAGRVRVSLGASGGSFDGERYWVIGGGIGYFVIDGLEIGFDVEQWIGRNSITQVSPQVRYVAWQLTVSPYAGAFYRHWFVQGFDDLDTAGARGGIIYGVGRGLLLGGGLVWERVLGSCAGDCDLVYPEIVLAASF